MSPSASLGKMRCGTHPSALIKVYPESPKKLKDHLEITKFYKAR